IVLASRADPPLPLAGLRAGGRLAELRADDLRLDTDEAAQLLASVAGHPVDETAAAALVGRTEGWAAGLHLAALSLRQHPDPSSFVERFCGTHRYILDYLTEEVLDHQPREIRQFLLDTCVLDRLSGPVCDAIRGATDSQQTLEQIEQSGLFLVPLDSNREWWRYHGLFADLLRSRFKYNDPDRFRRLHLAAAAWHDEQRLADDSIRHALAADDPELAAELAERYFDDFILSSEGATAERWASSLPDEVVHRRPGLLLGRARIDMYAGRLDEAERGLDAAEHALPWLTDEGYRPPSNGGR